MFTSFLATLKDYVIIQMTRVENENLQPPECMFTVAGNCALCK